MQDLFLNTSSASAYLTKILRPAMFSTKKGNGVAGEVRGGNIEGCKLGNMKSSQHFLGELVFKIS